MKKAVRLGLTSANNAEVVSIKGYTPDPKNYGDPKPLVAMLPILNIATIGSDSKHPIRAHIAIATLDDACALRKTAGEYVILIDKETYRKSKNIFSNKMVLALIDMITRIFFQSGSDMVIMHTDNTIEQLTMGDVDIEAHVATAEMYGYDVMKKAEAYQRDKIIKTEKSGSKRLHKDYKKFSKHADKNVRAGDASPADIFADEADEDEDLPDEIRSEASQMVDDLPDEVGEDRKNEVDELPDEITDIPEEDPKPKNHQGQNNQKKKKH